jgi:hypothetical protein
VIESTGVSEPLQVAETFALMMERRVEVAAGGRLASSGSGSGGSSQQEGEEPEGVPLRELAALDTCVTVVDAAGLLANMTSIATVSRRELSGAAGMAAEASEPRGAASEDEDKEEEEEEEEDANVAELMLEQVGGRLLLLLRGPGIAWRGRPPLSQLRCRHCSRLLPLLAGWRADGRARRCCCTPCCSWSLPTSSCSTRPTAWTQSRWAGRLLAACCAGVNAAPGPPRLRASQC